MDTATKQKSRAGLAGEFYALSMQMRDLAAQIRQREALTDDGHDDDAVILEDQCEAFEAGLQLRYPNLPRWKKMLDNVRRRDDPEYLEYLRLHKKYGF